MHHTTAPSDPDLSGDWTYSETIDEEAAAIHVHGRVDRLGVDLLRGSIEELERKGHRDITVTIDDHGSVDPTSAVVLARIAGHLADCHGRLRIRWADGGGEPAGPPRVHRAEGVSDMGTAP